MSIAAARTLRAAGMGIIHSMNEARSASSHAETNAEKTFPAGAHAESREHTASDHILIQRSQSGDLAAFDQLVLRYEKLVYNFAYRLTGNYDAASDVAQDAFLRAFNAIRSFRGDAAFSTWLFRITTNVFLDEKKKARSRPTQSLDEYIELEESSVGRQIVDPSETPEEIVAGKERSAVIANAIANLPDYQRAMVLLYHVHQKSYEEIAEMMNLPIGTVKSRLNRARLALKDKLSGLSEFFPS